MTDTKKRPFIEWSFFAYSQNLLFRALYRVYLNVSCESTFKSTNKINKSSRNRIAKCCSESKDKGENM